MCVDHNRIRFEASAPPCETLGQPPASAGFSKTLGRAEEQLSRIRESLTELGVGYTDVSPHSLGVGLRVAWSDVCYVVLSVAGAVPYMLNSTVGLLKDVAHDRIRILEVCNDLTRDNTFRPVYLHDAPAGWDIHVQQRLPLDVVVADAPFLRALVERLPHQADGLRSRFLEAGVSGEPYGLSAEDTQRLLVRSLT